MISNIVETSRRGTLEAALVKAMRAEKLLSKSLIISIIQLVIVAWCLLAYDTASTITWVTLAASIAFTVYACVRHGAAVKAALNLVGRSP